MTTEMPHPVDQLRDRIADALRNVEVGRWNIKAQADAVLGVLRADMSEAWQDWAQRGATLRSCGVPGCLAQFDLMATWTGEDPERWRFLKSVDVHGCPEHAQALWGPVGTQPGPDTHVAHWRQEEARPGKALLVCSCGWDAGSTRFRGHGTVLWQVHALEVLEAMGVRRDTSGIADRMAARVAEVSE